MTRTTTFFTVFASLICCLQAYAQQTTSRWSAPALEHAISIRNGHNGEPVAYEKFISELSSTDVVFLGELHTDETTHRFQLAVFESLLKSKQQQVVLALEMFERDVQKHLDDYLRGSIDEESFLVESRPWSNYREAYRPLIEHAKKTGTPVIAANFPTSLRRRLAMEGPKVLEALSADEKQLLPKKFYPNSPAYWKRTDNATRGHQGFMTKSDAEDERLYSTQSLWDNAMGEACADALDNHPGYSVLHLNGKFHSAYWDGAVHQLRLRKPKATIKTVSIVPELNPSAADTTGKPVADYVVYVEAQATNLDSGERTVQVGRELKYRFHLPPKANRQSPAPLLLWLADDGISAKEGMALCKQRFGDHAAIAVIETPYKAIGEDYAVGGRWYWSDTFSEDVDMLTDATQRIWAYLLRHFPLDANRVCLVGEGAGATVVAVVAVQSDRMKHQAIAIGPRQYAKVKDLPLPLPEYYGVDLPPAKSLVVIAQRSHQDWWQKELAQYNEVGVTSEFRQLAVDPWQAERQAMNLIRESLGLPAIPSESNDTQQYLLTESPSPRALHWARLQAHKLAQTSGIPTVAVAEAPKNAKAVQVPLSITADRASRDGALPKCPGPFGGTTVIVLPDHLDQDKVEKWLAIETEDPLAASSRFHRVRIATGLGDRSLQSILEKLQSENRKNILIAPAVFYSDLSWLRTLHQSVLKFQDSMTLHWLPGLGGRPSILSE